MLVLTCVDLKFVRIKWETIASEDRREHRKLCRWHFKVLGPFVIHHLQADSRPPFRNTLTLASLSASMMPPVCSCKRAYALWRAWYSFVNCRNRSSDSSAARLWGLKSQKSKSNYAVSVSRVLCEQWHLPTFVKKYDLFVFLNSELLVKMWIQNMFNIVGKKVGLFF